MGYARAGHGIGGDFDLRLSSLCEPDRVGFRVYFGLESGRYMLFTTARAALKWLLRHLNFDKDHILLLPSYLCPSIVAPVKDLQIGYDFYKVDERLQIKPEAVEAKLRDEVRGLLFIHYFGFPVGRDFLDYLDSLRERVVVIEDCVQALLTRQDGYWLGRRGNYSIASFRKLLPVPDGALLLSTTQLLPDVRLPRVWNEFLCKRVIGMMLKGEYLRLDRVDETGYELYFRLLHEAESACDKQIQIASINELAEKLLDKFEWEAIRLSRRSNYQHLAGRLEGIHSVTPLFPDLPAEVCPSGLPVVAHSPETRDKLRGFLVQHGVYPPVHWELPPEVSEDDFPESWDLSRRILTLPIDQRYGEVQMEYIIHVLRKFDRTVRCPQG